MYYLIFYSISALLFTPSYARSLYSDSSQEDLTRSNVNLQSVRNAVQLLARLQQINEHGSKVNSMVPSLKREGKSKKQYQGIDLDYIGISGEHYLDLNRLMELVQKNYQARGNVWKRSPSNPRVYYISNPEVLEQYWKNLQKKASSESSERDSRGYGAEIETNLLKYLMNLRRDGDENDIYNAEENPDGNRLNNNDDDNLAPEFRGTIGFLEENTKTYPFENTETTHIEVPSRFKSRDYNNDNFRSRKKSKSKFDHKIPAKVQRDDDDIKKSIESFKSAWKAKKENSVRGRSHRDDVEWKRPAAYNRPKVAVKERLRSNFVAGNSNAGGGYPPYGRTPVPFVGKRGIYEEE